MCSHSEDHRNGGREYQQDRDERAFPLVRVTEEDDEPVEDQPERTECQKNRQEEQGERQNRNGAAVEAPSKHLPEVVRHRASVAEEQHDRVDDGRQSDGRGEQNEKVRPAEKSSADIAQQISEAAQSSGYRASTIFVCSRDVRGTESNLGRLEIQLRRRLRRPLRDLGLALLQRLPGHCVSRRGVWRIDLQTICPPRGDELSGLLVRAI